MPKELEPKQNQLASRIKTFLIKTPEELRRVSEFASSICAQLNNKNAENFFNSGALNYIKSQPDSLTIAIKLGKKVQGFAFAYLIKGTVRDFVNCYVGTNSEVKDDNVRKMLFEKIVAKFKKYGHHTIFRIEGLTGKDVRNASKFFQGKGISFNVVSIAQPSGI